MTQESKRNEEYKAYQEAFAEEDPKAEDDAPDTNGIQIAGNVGAQAVAASAAVDAYKKKTTPEQREDARTEPGTAERVINELRDPELVKRADERRSMNKIRASGGQR
jgi:hypothetical protein